MFRKAAPKRSFTGIGTQHLVADADMGFDQVEAGSDGSELFAKRRHIHAQGDDVGLHATAPDVVDDIGMCQDFARIGGKE